MTDATDDPRDGETADLERRWQAARASPAREGAVRLLVVRTARAHETPARIEVSPAGAIHGDRWSAGAGADRDAAAQVSLIDRRVADVLVGGDPARWHVPGDNLVVDLALDEAALPAGTRLAVGSALIEISAKPHTGCGKFAARLGAAALRWVNVREHRARRLRGVYARIIEGGAIAVGDRIEVLPRPPTQPSPNFSMR